MRRQLGINLSLRPHRPLQKLRRIVTRCASTEEFVATYSRQANDNSILVGLQRPQPVGISLPFEILLSDGTRILGGRAKILTLYSSPTRPRVRLRFEETDRESQIILDRLNRGKTAVSA